MVHLLSFFNFGQNVAVVEQLLNLRAVLVHDSDKVSCMVQGLGCGFQASSTCSHVGLVVEVRGASGNFRADALWHLQLNCFRTLVCQILPDCRLVFFANVSDLSFASWLYSGRNGFGVKSLADGYNMSPKDVLHFCMLA